MIAAQARLAHDILEGDVGRARHRGRERPPGRAVGIARGREQHREIGALHHLGLVAVVEHGEARRHVGLERKLLQQPGAQRVNGLDLQPARRLQRTGEQLARRGPQPDIGRGDSHLADRGVERGVIERDPVSERGEHPLRHVGGGRLGEGDAEDLLRRDALQQQPDHALDQDMRLAGPGIGRDESGRRRVRGAGLRRANFWWNGPGCLHHSSNPNPPAADHSLIRARSS